MLELLKNLRDSRKRLPEMILPLANPIVTSKAFYGRFIKHNTQNVGTWIQRANIFDPCPQSKPFQKDDKKLHKVAQNPINCTFASSTKTYLFAS